MMAADLKTVVPAIGVSFNTPVGEGAKSIGMVFQTHLPGDLPDADVNAKLDKFMEYARRQQVIGRIPDLKKEVDKYEFNIKNLEEDVEKLDRQAQEKYSASGREGAVKLRADEKAARENAMVNVKRYKEMLDTIKKELAEAEALLKIHKKEAAKAA